MSVDPRLDLWQRQRRRAREASQPLAEELNQGEREGAATVICEQRGDPYCPACRRFDGTEKPNDGRPDQLCYAHEVRSPASVGTPRLLQE